MKNIILLKNFIFLFLCSFISSFLYGEYKDFSDEFILSKNNKDILHYINLFPINEYKIINILNNGSYYIDDIDDVIKNSIKNGEIWEKHIVDNIKKWTKPNSVVLDIGAHIGCHTLILSQTVGENGKVLAFEPQPKIFRELVMNMQLNNIKNVFFYNSAVGDEDGMIELSPLVKGNEGATALIGGTGKFVDILKIDSLNLENISLIKIDVERMEDQVLEGAKQTLINNMPVIILEIQGGYCIQTAPINIKQKILSTISKLYDLGYEVNQIFGADWLAIPKIKYKMEVKI